MGWGYPVWVWCNPLRGVPTPARVAGMTQTQTPHTATLIKGRLGAFQGDASLYRLDPPLDGHAHVVVSAAVVPFSGPETYIFGADSNGEILDWSELDGSFRGVLDHAAALTGAGYELDAEAGA